MDLGVEYGFIRIDRRAVAEGWDDIKTGDIITVFFEYIGESDSETISPLGFYDHFEYYED